MSEWYLSRNGEQEGPLTAQDIAGLLASGEIRAGEAFAWKEGMAEWKTITESGVLAEASMAGIPRATATPSAVAAPSPVQLQTGAQPATTGAVNPYSTPATGVSLAGGYPAAYQGVDQYPGIGRLAYVGLQIGISIVAYVLLFVLVLGAGAAESLRGAFGGFILIMILAGIAGIYIGVKRVQNLGMSGWAVLWSFVPILSIWISWRMFACPAGYDHHKQLDTAGKVLTGLMIGLVVLGVVANIFVAASGSSSY